jgi:hypothetical protein
MNSTVFGKPRLTRIQSRTVPNKGFSVRKSQRM